MSRRSLPVAASLLMLTSVTAAQQPAHVHGIATLNLAMEGDELEIEFVSPAGNIVGFEHEAPSKLGEDGYDSTANVSSGYSMDVESIEPYTRR